MKGVHLLSVVDGGRKPRASHCLDLQWELCRSKEGLRKGGRAESSLWAPSFRSEVQREEATAGSGEEKLLLHPTVLLTGP